MMTDRIRSKRQRFPRTWQNVTVTLLLGILMLGLTIPTPLTTSDYFYADSNSNFPQLDGSRVVSSVGSAGNDIDSVMVYSRKIQGLDFALMNSFSDTTSHLETIDFSSYHIDGWSLYEVQISTSKVVALLEHEFTQSSSNPNFTEFTIREHSGDVYYDQLAQGFYDMSHDGQLQNVSLLYVCPNYDPPNHDYAYMDIRSDYTDGSTNMVSSVQLENVGLTPTWANVTESVVLNADTIYYTVMNGTELVDVGSYPQIIWFYVDGAGSFTSRRHNTDGDTWGSERPLEALLNYTYIPWNTTSDSALEFQNPMSVTLQGNSSSLTGSEWIFSSMSNVSQVHFSSNQSISIEYDLTLRYKQNNTSTASWYAGTSGADVEWNVTSVLDFPELSGSQDKNLTLVLPDDWTAEHLFNITNPMQYYDHFTQTGTSVECTDLADETWILKCTSPNYLQSLSKFDTSDDSTINYKVSVSVTMDINATIESPLADPATNGKASLRVFYQNSVEYAENYSVTSGKSYHRWDISTQSSSNGLHTIDLYWTNGTEVGYLTSDVLVYYKTTLVADEYTIDAFTDDTFYIGIDFNQIFPAGGIDASAADVSYSFGSVVNQSLDDKSNGRWDATVSTASMTPDTHTLTVYAEGYALENRSITIDVTLIHDTNILTIQWLDSNNISFIDTTELRVEYTRVGDIPVADAMVNVTIDGEIITLTWDSDLSLYRLTFNGTDTYSGFDTYDLTINAWKVGHKAQTDISQNLTIHHEYTNFAINWSHGTDITYIEYTILIVSYQMSDSSAIPIANVNVTDDITTWPLHWNGTDGTYWIKFNGTDSNPGYGTHNLTIQTSKFGYESHENTSYSLMVSKVPTSLELSWSNGNTISYVQTTKLVMNYTMLDGSPIVDAIVNVTIGVDFWTIEYDSETRTYNLILNGSDINPGLGNYPVVVLADLIGYDGKLNDTYSFTIDLESTTMSVSWSAGSDISYVQTTILNVTYLMSNSSPVEGALVNVTINGHAWNMTWDDSTSYLLVFNGSDTIPGFGIHNLTIIASRFGYESRSNITETLDVHEESTTFNVEWSGSTIVTYVGSVTLYVDYEMSNGTVIPNATVEVTIGTDVFEMNYTSNRYWYQFNGNDLLPGFGNHTLTIEADKFGYQYHNLEQTLNITEEPTTLVLTWSNTNSITYINSTTLIANFTQSDGSPIIDAIVNVTVGTGSWPMDWNPLTFVYELTFNGTDTIPGFGTYNVTVLAGDTGFVDRSNSNEDLIVSLESTSITITWSNTDNITYIEQTTLIVSYRMSNDSVIPVDATVNVTIGETRWDLGWDSDTDTYRLVFNGTDIPPGIDTHNLTIRIGKYGYFNHVNSTITLTITEVPTSQHVYWSNTNSITYTQSTTLTVNYTMADGSPVTDAIMNVSTSTGFWNMTLNKVTFVYELTFNGTDIDPGFGTHSLTIRIGKFGYSNPGNLTESLTLNPEPTSMSMAWLDASIITYLESTILKVNYEMGDSTPIPNATVTATSGGVTYVLEWQPGSEDYRYTFRGSDNSPGIGFHSLTIDANRTGFVSQSDVDFLTINDEPTLIDISWSNNNTITFVESTILIINYTMSNGTPITEATVNATIGVFPAWDLIWDSDSETYRLTFNGTDVPPGLGFHNITIRADKFGYENYIVTRNITLDREPTYLIVSWIPDNDITYLTSSILAVSYRMNDSTPISGAVLNVTYGTAFWPLIWNDVNQDYRLQINGSDVAPGYGNFTLNIQASKSGYYEAENITQWVLIREEPTNIVVQWANGINNPDFLSYTYLIVDYLYDEGSLPVTDATLEVTVNSNTFEMEWNITEGYYQLRINGSDSYLGVGTNNITILAGKYGFENKISNSEVVIPVIPTKLSLVWAPSNTITYVKHTTLQAHYTMYNDTLILGASVNVTINGMTLPMSWNSTSNSYERTFYGSDSTLGVTTNFSILVEALIDDFQGQSNSDERLFIQTEPTSLLISWIGGDNITYFSQTTLSVQFIMSNDTPISTGTLNATINGSLWILEYNEGNEAYEAIILGNDARLDYLTYNVTINASAYGYVSLIDSSQNLTIRLEDTYLDFEWVPSNTISYLDSTVFRIYYRYSSDNSSVEGATVNATYLSTWVANYNNDSGAYEIIFTGSDFPTPIPGTHALSVAASKANHQPQTDNLQEITIVKENTFIESWWLDGDNKITFVENTTIYINYSIAASGIPIVNANVTVRIGTTTWDTVYNPVMELYSFTFTGDMDPPGLGSYGLFISASYSLHEGYQDAEDNSQTLEIESATVSIDSYWITSGTITYLQQTTLVVNYTLTGGESIPLAQVNVTINQTYWFALWDEASETYRLIFNGTDVLPGLGFHELDIRANRTGFDPLTDGTLRLNITEEPTVLIPRWSNPHQNNITYFEYTYLFVDYLLANTTPITFATVSVTIGSDTWVLDWDDSESAYGIRFNGSDVELGFGINSLTITALKHGYEYKQNTTETLELLKDPTSIQITWSQSNNITYVKSTKLIVHYKMSNGTPISVGTVTATIGTDGWPLSWNASSEAYEVVFDGDMSPPGLGIFSVQIDASAAIFATQSTSEPLTLREEPTSAIASWTAATIDWTESIILGIDYRDTYGMLIDGATQKTITINGSTYVLQGTNGTYWMSFDNSFDLGHHVIVVNISKFGYEFAVNAVISFDIVEASTDISAIWSTTTIDYFGQIDLTVDYTYLGTGDSIPVGLVVANITIDGITTLSLIQSGDLWTITLDGDYLDLGSYSVVILVQAYGYTYAAAGQTLTVNEVSTVSSGYTWTPSNLTIQYTDSLELVVDYTYAGGDVPEPASVNVTIEGLLYELLYSVGAWRISIPGIDLGIGIYDADISAWAYGYELRTYVTSGINVTIASNSFAVTWDPLDLTPTYIDQVNLTVAYTEDFLPIMGSTIRLYINGTVYDLTNSSIDEMWHFSINAATIDLGIWNVTVTANKTGYADGYYTGLLTVVLVPTILDIIDTGDTFYYDETTAVDIFYNMSSVSVVPGAAISFTLDSIEQPRTRNVDHWSAILNGIELGVGIYTFTIITSAYGYETQIDTIEITVLSIPTHVIQDANVAIYAREFVSFRFTYIDDRSSSPILANEFDTIWSEFYNIVTLPNYTYVVTVGGTDIHVGNYTFQLTLGRLGFDNSTGAIDIDVYPIPIQFVYETTYSQYENETILIEVQVLDVAHATLIDWANVVIELEGVGYVAIYDSGNSSYVVTFRLPLNIVPGPYSLYLHAEAEDCLVADVITSLEVLEKSTYILSLDVLAQVQAESTMIVSVSATEDSQPVQGISVAVTIIVHLSDGGQQIIVEEVITDIQGLATITFDVPHDAIELEIRAIFSGSISEWPAETAMVTVDVTPAGTGDGAPIVLDPLILTLITGVVSLPLLALAFRRRRRRGGGSVSATVSVAPVTPVAPPTSPLSEMQRKLRDEIVNSEDGVTRAELSRRLGPSASKIGTMVKDLLNSDSGFYEVREGAKKLIKFRNPD